MSHFKKSIFIGGTGRCGTSILNETIGHHPSITTIPEEFRLHIAPGGFIDLKHSLTEDWSRTRGNAAIHDFLSLCDTKRSIGPVKHFLERFFQKVFHFSFFGHIAGPLDESDCFGSLYNRKVQELVNQLVTSRSQSSHPESPGNAPYFFETKRFDEGELSRLLSDFMDDLFRKVDDTNETWCEDSPPNLLHLQSLNQIFSDRTVKFIHLVRKPEDVVASLLRETLGWSPETFDNALIAIKEMANEIDRSITSNHQIDVKHIRFENLINHPEKTLKELFHFLNEQYTEHIPLPDANKANIGRGKQTFDKKQLKRIDHELSWYYEKYGDDPR